MEFLKKHYEKILLGLVLAGLVGALVFLPFYISSDEQRMRDLTDSIIHPRVTALTNVDLSAGNAVVLRLHTAYKLDLENTNKLFNPMQWDKALDGTLIPAASHLGAKVVVVTDIKPLYFKLTLDSVDTNFGARYNIGVEKQASRIPSLRRKIPHFVSLGDRPNDTFSLVQVKGPADNPDGLVLKLVDSGELVTISRDKPFRRVDGYSADFRYDPEKKVFRDRRVGDVVAFNGTDYLVDEINKNELILQDESNQKKTSLHFPPD